MIASIEEEIESPMLKMIGTVVVVAVIYVHSPVRPQGGWAGEIARLRAAVASRATESVARSDLARDVAERAVRQTLAAGLQQAKAADDEQDGPDLRDGRDRPVPRAAPRQRPE